jgi:outer membrane receptor protein involved in Fe transport
LVGILLGLCAAASELEAVRTFNIAPQKLETALIEFSKQANIQVIGATATLADTRTKGINGTLTSREALQALLRGTSVAFNPVGTQSVQIVPVPDKTTASGDASSPGSIELARVESPSSPQREEEVEAPQYPESESSVAQEGASTQITVTGSRVRGARASSPVVTVSQEDMRYAGHTNLGEVARSLPQNFGGGQNPEIARGADINTQNVTGSSGINLRGLGADATLTLLNGARLPYDGFFQATDVSVIPIAVIDRMEVLLDGASAIYGSDAVGGVTNIILKRDYEGFELAARHGAATDGGNSQAQYIGVGGTTWRSGGFLMTGDYTRNSAIFSRQRDYLSYMPERNSIYPAFRQKGGLFSGHQRLAGVAELTIDAFYTEREQSSHSTSLTTYTADRRDSTIWGISSALAVALPQDWSLRLHGAHGMNDSQYDSNSYDVATSAFISESSGCYCNEAESAEAGAEGPLFALPGGDARFSLGAGYRRNMFYRRNYLAPTGLGNYDASRRSRHAFGEINLPLISPERNIRGLARLSINGAFRHEDYDDFGKVTTPKVGVVWGLTRNFDVKASWGKSFKAPTLLQQHQEALLYVFGAGTFGAVGAPAGALGMMTFGGNPLVGPERAETFTAGFAARAPFAENLSVGLNYFYVDYTDRVVQPISPFSQALLNPAFAGFLTLNPDLAQQDAAIAGADQFLNFSGAAYDPANVIVIVHNAYTNATLQKVSGFDLFVGYATDFLGGDLSLTANANWIDGHRNLTSLSPQQSTAGVVYFPAGFRGRGGMSWSRGGLTLTSHLNYTGAVADTRFTPNPRIGSMTTVDAVLNYELQPRFARGLSFNIAVINLLDQAPAYLQPLQAFHTNYDSTNQSAIGRVVNATVTLRF